MRDIFIFGSGGSSSSAADDRSQASKALKEAEFALEKLTLEQQMTYIDNRSDAHRVALKQRELVEEAEEKIQEAKLIQKMTVLKPITENEALKESAAEKLRKHFEEYREIMEKRIKKIKEKQNEIIDRMEAANNREQRAPWITEMKIVTKQLKDEEERLKENKEKFGP